MYKMLEIQDVSRPRCKRYIGHLVVEEGNKTAIKRVIKKAVNEIQQIKFPVHVVWLYVWHKDKLKCRAMWVDKDLKDVPLPLPLDFKDHKGDIGIVWL